MIPKCTTNTRENPCNWTPSLNLFTIVELSRNYLHFIGSYVDDNKLFMEQITSICTIEKAGGLNIFAQMFFEQLKKSVNFRFSCPMRKVSLNLFYFEKLQIAILFFLRNSTQSIASKSHRPLTCWRTSFLWTVPRTIDFILRRKLEGFSKRCSRSQWMQSWSKLRN